MRDSSFVIAVACLAATSFPAAQAGDETDSIYSVGLSSVDITPQYPIRLNGFGNRRDESEGVSQPIHAKAIAIAQGDQPPLVLVAIDSLGIRLPMVEDIAKRLEASHNLPRANFAVTFTHSHCTPKVNGASDNIFSTAIPPEHQAHIDRYTVELAANIEKAARLALDSRKPSRIEHGTGNVQFAKNRRLDGGPVDHDLPVLLVRDAESREIRGFYVSYACHCVTLSFNQISGDWAGYAAEMIEKRNPGAVAMVSIGAGSDQNPVSGVTGDHTETAEAQGVEIATEVDRLLSTGLRPIAGTPTASFNRIPLPLNPPPSREQLEKMAGDGGRPADRYNATTQLARLDRGEALLTEIDYPIQTWTFGDDLCLVFLAGEVCVDYSLRLKTELDRSRFWLNAYSNDFCSYIPSERLVGEGGYGGGAETPYFALPTTLKGGLEQLIVDEVHRQVDDAFDAPRGTQGVAPKSPDDSLRCMKTHDEFEITLAAAEPNVTDPVAIDFGTDGRLWVAEMNDYGRGVYEEFEQGGRIRWLRDTDSDGVFDQAHTYVDGLRFPTDVKVWRDGVLICDAPDILFARDTDGDGTADDITTLLTGFDVRNAQARVNSLRFGIEGLVYGSCGLFGGTITAEGRDAVALGARDFAFDPDQPVVIPVTGRTQQGRCRNDRGDWFGCTNGTLLMHYGEPNWPDLVESPTGPTHDSLTFGPQALQLFSPQNLVRFELSGAPGTATAACGLEIYRDEALGTEYRGNALTCEPVNQLVHRLVLEPHGMSFTAQRAANEADTEFLTSTDQWFRPVQVRTGPDGAIWVVDMYRYVIEHSRWIPQSTLEKVDVYAGRQRGRIYRVAPRKTESHPTHSEPLIPDLESLRDPELVGRLSSPNGTQRDLAHQLLVWRHATVNTTVLNSLEQLAISSPSPITRLHALSILRSAGKLSGEIVSAALKSPDPDVICLALRFTRDQTEWPAEHVDQLIRLATHSNDRVRRQVAWSLGRCDCTEGAKAIAMLASTSEASVSVRNAALSSVSGDNVAAVLAEYRQLPMPTQDSTIRGHLISQVVQHGDADAAAAAIQSLIPAPINAGVFQTPIDTWSAPLVRTLDAADERYRDGRVPVNETLRSQLAALHRAAVSVLMNRESSDQSLQTALTLLGRKRGSLSGRMFTTSDAQSELTESELIDAICEPISAKRPVPVQMAAVAAIAATGQPQIADRLISRFGAVSAETRDAMLDVLLSRPEWTERLTMAMQAGTLPPSQLNAARRGQLLNHPSDKIAGAARTLFNNPGASGRNELIAAWQSAVPAAGDANRGRTVFRKLCSTCHRLEDYGHVVGPDLRALTNHDSQWLLTTLLDPNRQVDARYMAWTALTADGRTVSGMLVEESAATVTLREAGGKDHVLARSRLEELQSTNRSFMPEGLEKDLSPENAADVIAYLAAVQSPPKSFPGNKPSLITPDERGTLSLTAASAEIRGGDIMFEEPFGNVGYWHSAADTVTWRIQRSDVEHFDVYIDASCANAAPNNRLRLEGGVEPLTYPVEATGGWDRYRQSRIGAITLPAGTSTIVARADVSLSGALVDLREIRLVPLGLPPKFTAAAASDVPLPRYPAQIAPFLLDESQSLERRQQVIDDRPGMGAAIVAALVADLPPDNAELEYRLIPWIWRTALAVGKRNDGGEIRDLLDVSLPQPNQPLRDWQAVVIGGGIINGLSQVDQWPGDQIAEILKAAPEIRDRWTTVLPMASDMANDASVRSGTRYDALRMVALNEVTVAIPQLARYLNPDDAELQMGAVSGLADIRSDEATRLIVDALPGLSGRNAQLALAAMIRTPDRENALVLAIESGRVKLSASEFAFLEEHGSSALQERVRARRSK